MQGMMGMSAPLPQADPMMMGGMPSMDGMSDPTMGMQAPAPEMPGMPGMGGGFPSTDPEVLMMILQELMGLQQQDHAALQGMQDDALMQVLMMMTATSGGDTAGAGFAEGGLPMPMDSGAAMGMGV